MNSSIAWLTTSFRNFPISINKIYLGGYELISGIKKFLTLSKKGFTGCIEIANFNNISLLHKPLANLSYPRCFSKKIAPISFVSNESYLVLNRGLSTSGFRISFSIITYLKFATLIFHKDSRSTLNISLSNGFLLIKLDFENVNYIHAYLPDVSVNDGEWHKV